MGASPAAAAHHPPTSTVPTHQSSGTSGLPPRSTASAGEGGGKALQVEAVNYYSPRPGRCSPPTLLLYSCCSSSSTLLHSAVVVTAYFVTTQSTQSDGATCQRHQPPVQSRCTCTHSGQLAGHPPPPPGATHPTHRTTHTCAYMHAHHPPCPRTRPARFLERAPPTPPVLPAVTHVGTT